MQLDRNVPLRKVSIEFLVVGAETSVDSAQTLDARVVDTLQSTDPQFEVRVDRVLHEDRHVHTLQGIGDLLHSERVSRGARTDPEQIHAILQSLLDVLSGSHLGSDEHARLLLHLLQPWQSRHTVTLEAPWLGTWFPHTGAEHLDTVLSQLLSSIHHLLFRLRATWSRDHQRTFIFNTLQIQFL